MRIDDHLNRESDSGKKLVRHIGFEGDRGGAMSVRRWWDKALGQLSSRRLGGS